GIQEIKPFTLPGTTAADNTADFSLNVELAPNLNDLIVSRTSTFEGIQKIKAISGALKYTPYMFDDYKNYGGSDPSETMKSKQDDEYNNSIRTVKEEYKKRKP